jgi:hypothetical protein
MLFRDEPNNHESYSKLRKCLAQPANRAQVTGRDAAHNVRIIVVGAAGRAALRAGYHCHHRNVFAEACVPEVVVDGAAAVTTAHVTGDRNAAVPAVRTGVVEIVDTIVYSTVLTANLSGSIS